MRTICTLKRKYIFLLFNVRQNPFLLKVFRFYVLGLMTLKKDSASESTLSLPPGEELKTVTEKDGNIIYNFCSKNLIL